MKKFLSLFRLKQEADLLNSWLYIIKSFLAVATAVIIIHNFSILKLDTISILFGLMLTLEPVTLTGIRNGLSQLYASVLGALSTAIIIYFLGINAFSIGLSMAFTLYVCLKLNWREVSAVAIFTSIYMTQYVQKTPQGVPSIFLTFRLRMLALGVGVLIAIIYNLIFSSFYYRSMVYKRISYLLKNIIESMEKIMQGLQDSDKAKVSDVKQKLPKLFNDIDWCFSLFDDIKKEYRFKLRVISFSKKDIEKLQNIILSIRSINHMNYDMSYILLEDAFNWAKLSDNKNRILKEFSSNINELKKIKCIFDKKNTCIVYGRESIGYDGINGIQEEEYYTRLIHDLREINRSINAIKAEAAGIEPIKKTTGMNIVM